MISAFTVNLILSPNALKSGGVRDYGNLILIGLINTPGLLTFGVSELYTYRYYELLPFCLLGVIGGCLGALFVKLNVALNKWRRDVLGQHFPPKFFEVTHFFFCTIKKKLILILVLN